uniref:Uncharacterized protein n=1 Tax=Arundo donax TaxID=35708 RepID=A0A0A9FGB8_ARUDO
MIEQQLGISQIQHALHLGIPTEKNKSSWSSTTHQQKGVSPQSLEIKPGSSLSPVRNFHFFRLLRLNKHCGPLAYHRNSRGRRYSGHPERLHH